MIFKRRIKRILPRASTIRESNNTTVEHKNNVNMFTTNVRTFYKNWLLSILNSGERFRKFIGDRLDLVDYLNIWQLQRLPGGL